MAVAETAAVFRDVIHERLDDSRSGFTIKPGHLLDDEAEVTFQRDCGGTKKMTKPRTAAIIIVTNVRAGEEIRFSGNLGGIAPSSAAMR